ncbi:PadR family transcriptional regulator [Haladaptatus sp. T7]|uniref:PadR family transcriptional regulator n=1 Tax=Haladaptatus sp. T7 TaxID=2029368 RepID=UPI00222FC0A3|nr:PadR family transcriptional regulator [Haladaptatus sp. T7]
MSGDDLKSAIESVQEWTGSRRNREDGSATQTALVVSCSMSDCSWKPLWPVDATWNVIGVQTLGNQTWDQYEGQVVLDSDIELLETQHDITAVLIVGHTRCQVLEDAYDRWIAPDSGSPAGIEARLKPLRSLVGDAFEEGLLTDSMPPQTRQNRLVEYNVCRQVVFLKQALPSSVTVAGYVHDQDGAYNSFPDKQYLVALDGETEPTTIRARLPDDTSVQVTNLLT